MTDKKWKQEHNAIKYLMRHLYDLDKAYQFKFPQAKTKLQPYAVKLRGIVEDVLNIAGINRIKGHEIEYETPAKKKDESKEESDE